VLRLLDARVGGYSDVTPLRPGLLRMCAYVRNGKSGSEIADLRVLLVADLLTRAAELDGLQVVAAIIGAEQAGSVTAWNAHATEFGFRPSPVYASCQQARSQLGGPIDLHVLELAGFGPGPDGIAVFVGSVTPISYYGDDATSASSLCAERRWEPLAVRLALMRFRYGQAAHLTESALTSSTETLRDWRRRVAEWAESPSRPIPQHILDAIHAAFNDVDTVSALALLHDLANERALPPGAKFETFVYADRVLGLELAREIGQPPGL
jgi:hypothetical protein